MVDVITALCYSVYLSLCFNGSHRKLCVWGLGI